MLRLIAHPGISTLRHPLHMAVRASAVLLCACTPPAANSNPDGELSRFVADSLVSGRVLENIKACQVDATCYLRIEFADTTVDALYGTGERPAPPCDMTREVSDTAFRVEPRDIVRTVISMCGADGLYLRRIAREAG